VLSLYLGAFAAAFRNWVLCCPYCLQSCSLLRKLQDCCPPAPWLPDHEVMAAFSCTKTIMANMEHSNFTEMLE
jgi:hypothetical protein